MIGTTIKTAIVTAISFANVTNTITKRLDTTGYSQFELQLGQDSNHNLTYADRIDTYEYSQQKIGNIITQDARGIRKIQRNFITNYYELTYYTYVRNTVNSLNLSSISYLYDLGSYESVNIPNIEIATSENLSIYITNSVDTIIDNYIDKTDTYANYQALDQLIGEVEVGINQDYTRIYNDVYSNGFPSETATTTYLLFKVNIVWDGENITDNGVFLINLPVIRDHIPITTTYTATIDTNNYEVIDLPGLMFDILGMPFAWLSTAFNLTIFPGTPYAINISHIIMAILGCLLLIVIVKKVIK